MWNRLSGKKNEATESPTSKTSARKDDDDPSQHARSTKATDARRNTSGKASDGERVFNPTSTAYSSTSRAAYPNTAGASVASSHATASANGNDGPYTAPVLNRNQSLAEKMPQSSPSSRSGRDRKEDRASTSIDGPSFDDGEDDGRRDKKSRRSKTERKSSLKSSGKSRSDDVKGGGTTRGPDDFSQQVGSSGFQPFPGQFDGSTSTPAGDQNGASGPPEHEAMSSHVQDQFPGQFPSESAAPYRPPLAASEGGPGLAAEYYGDAGQSVAEQPGYRRHSPSLIVGQEPHLLPASSVAAPPPEPSASGGVGAAASFFSGDFEANETLSSHTQQTSSVHTSAPGGSNMTATSSGLSGLGGAAMGATAAMGAAAGYLMGNHSSAQGQDTISTVGASTEYISTSSQRPPSNSQESYHSSASRPPTSSSRPSHTNNIPIYAAAAAGVAGLAGSAMHSNHYSHVNASSNQQYATPTTPRHRHRGPLGALADFVKDPEGVAQFEEYSEYVGICRGCFEPGSSPRDAPRRHRYFNRKRSDERIGYTSRVEKSRRDGSDDERRGKNSPSWLATGLAGYGLGKMGEGLFKQTQNFDDTYSVKSGRYSPEGGRRRRQSRESEADVLRPRRSRDQLETGIVYDDRTYGKENKGPSKRASAYSARTRSRSKSNDRKSSRAEAALGTAASASIVSSTSRRRDDSADRGARRSQRAHQDGSPSGRRQKSRRKKEKGFFSFGSNSSSSSIDLTRQRGKKKHKADSDDKKAEAALLGLGAATAALAAADRSSSHKKSSIKELVGRKETLDKPHKRSTLEEAAWEDEEEDDILEVASVDSGLAFGNDSDVSDRRRSSRDNELPMMTGAVGEEVSLEQYEPSSRHERPGPSLQYVDPTPVADFEQLNERMANSKPFTTRPPLVSRPSNDTPFHQPQPRAPVSSSVYATEAPYSQAHSATAGPMDTSARFYDAREGPDHDRHFEMRRRDTSPARFGPDETSNEVKYRRKPSAKDDLSTVSSVRFALSEKDEDLRREKRQRKSMSKGAESPTKEYRERNSGLDSADESQSKRISDQESRRSDNPVESSDRSWAIPAAVGLAGAVVGAAAMAESRKDSNEEETKEGRRERRRREKRRDEEEDEARRERRRREKKDSIDGYSDKKGRSQDDDAKETREERKTRRRREREEREAEATSPNPSHVSFADLPRRPDQNSEEKSSSERQASPSKQEAYKHEDYSSFFTPAIDANDDQQVKISGANADADISFDQSPSFVIAEPTGLRDLSDTPGILAADHNATGYPRGVPRLRLLYPTPPSTRGSTPIIAPRDLPDDIIEEPSEITPSENSPHVLAQKDDQSNDEVAEPETSKNVDRFRDPPSDDDLERLERRKPKKIPLSIDQEDTPAGIQSYGDDNNFAAVLAASAEDAGFDPSIVIDNPTYRRRESPPGSDSRQIPGSFEDEDDGSSLKKSKRKDKSSKRQKERSDDAVVQDIVKQVERAEPLEQGDPEINVEDSSTIQIKKTKKSKKGSKRSSASVDALGNQELPETTADDGNRLSYEEAVEGDRSVTTSTKSSKDDGDRKQSKKSKAQNKGLEEAAGAVAIASTVEAAKETKSSGKKKGSIWDRVLGKSSASPSETSQSKDVKEDDPEENFGKDSKSIRNTSTSIQGRDESKREGSHEEAFKPEPQAGQVTLPSEGLVSQRAINGSDPEQSQERASESFLGERPDPPPPPDISEEREEMPRDMTVGLPKGHELRMPSEQGPRRPSDISIVDVPLSPRMVSSPTAVPIHFRRPTHVRARSSSQSPLSSVKNADEMAHLPRPRPRSTQFENSKEYRPLWLVEKNQSRQEAPRDETYPSLPSSHSTTRDSSLHSPSRRRDPEVTEEGMFDPVVGKQSLPIDNESRDRRSSLLDSQQATPTAELLQRPSATAEQPSPPDSRSSSPMRAGHGHDKHKSAMIRDATLAAVIGGAAGLGLQSLGERDESQNRDLAEEESRDRPDDSEDGLMATGDKPSIAKSDGISTPPTKKEKRGKKSKKRALAEPVEEATPATDVTEGLNRSTESGLPASSGSGTPANEAAIKVASMGEEPNLGNDISSGIMPVKDDALKDRLERSESKKSKKKKKGQKGISDVGLLVGAEPDAWEAPRDEKIAPPGTVTFANPFEESAHDHIRETQLSPLATPLPHGDDLDLLQEPSEQGFHDREKDPMENAQKQAEEIDDPRGVLEANADDLYDGPSKKKKDKKSKKKKQNVLEEDGAADAEPLNQSAVDDIKRIEVDEPREETIPTSANIPLADAEEAEDDFMGFSTKKKGKKGKKSKSKTQEKEFVDDLTARETEEMPLAENNVPLQIEDPQESGPLDTAPTPRSINDNQVSTSSRVDQGSDAEYEKEPETSKQRLTDPPFDLLHGTDPEQQNLDQPLAKVSESDKPVPEHPNPETLADDPISYLQEPFENASSEPPLLQEDAYESTPKKKKSKKSKKRGDVDLERGEDALPQASMPQPDALHDLSNTSHAPFVPESTDGETMKIDQSMHEILPTNHHDVIERVLEPDNLTSTSERNVGGQALGAAVAVTGTALEVQNLLRNKDGSQTPPIDTEFDTRTDADKGSIVKPVVDDTVEPGVIEGLPAESSEDAAKSRKAKSDESSQSAIPLATEAVETDGSARNLEDSALEAGEDDFISFPMKKTKKDKKDKKRKALSTSASQGQESAMPSETANDEFDDLTDPRSINTTLDPSEANAAILSRPETNELATKEIADDDIEILSAPKSKKDKKKKKRKDPSGATEGLQTPDLADDLDLQADADLSRPEVTESSASVEPPNEVDEVEELPEVEPAEEVVSQPKSKKDKKKAKKAKATAFDADSNDATIVKEAVVPTATRDVNVLDEQTASMMANPTEELRQEIEAKTEEPAKTKGKKGKKKSSKAKDFSWGAFESNGPDEEPLIDGLPNDTKVQSPLNDKDSATKGIEEDADRRIGVTKEDRITREAVVDDAAADEANFTERMPVNQTEEDEAAPWKGNDAAKDETTYRPETPGLDRTESSFAIKAYAIETPGLERNEPSYRGVAPGSVPIITPVQGPRDIPEQLTFADIVEPSVVEEPQEERGHDSLARKAAERQTPPEADLVDDLGEDFGPAKKTKKGKKSKKSKVLDEDSSNIEQATKRVQDIEPVDDVLIVEGHQAHAPNDPEYASTDARTSQDRKRGRNSVQISTDEPQVFEDLSHEAAETKAREQNSQPDTPLSAGSVDMLSTEEQREYNEMYQRQLEKELSPLRGEDDLLDNEEQRGYNEEYSKELERQLSVSEGASKDTIPAAVFDGQSDRQPLDVQESVEQPIPSPLEATIHHTVLSDIIEEREPKSRSGSLQEPPAEVDDGIKRKKSKKDKKSKKSRQPVIWEDGTATVGLIDERETATSHEEPSGSADHGETSKEETGLYKDLPSPTRGSPSASRSPKFDDGAQDYFAVKPRSRADEDVGNAPESPSQIPISPEQAQAPPDWSSHSESHPLAVPAVGATATDLERPRRERSPSRERPPRQRSPSPERAQRRSSLPRDEPPVSQERSNVSQDVTAAAAIGAGMLGAAALSKKESKKAKKRKGARTLDKLEDQPKPEDADLMPEQIEARDMLDETETTKKLAGLPGQFDTTPPQSSLPFDKLQPSVEEPRKQVDLEHRDSAIQIADSPVVPSVEPVHRPQHDSGYPATDFSPVINDYDKEGQEEREIIDPYTDPRVRGSEFYQNPSGRPKSISSDPRWSIAESDDQDLSGDKRKSRRRRQRHGSNVTYDSDDSNDSGYDKQRRRRQALMAEEPREPSPVSSTTKNRSSVLFDSSPSDRQALDQTQILNDDDLPENHGIHDQPSPELRQGPQKARHEGQSIFGGPVNEEEILSDSRSPPDRDPRGREDLRTIPENDLEASPLARKARKARKSRQDLSDVGSPNAGPKAQKPSHDMSPLVTEAAAAAAVIGTEDLVGRFHKPSQDEDEPSLDNKSSSSRGQDHPRRLSNQSNISAPNRDSEWRRQAIGSPDSIHAIIRTPDQVRSSSGQSLRSSGTPPLRRVDRSVSGDLRGASLKSDASRRAKFAEAEPAFDPAISIPSSSKYDPLTDKGKHRGDMADVFVSIDKSLFHDNVGSANLCSQEGDGWRGESPMSPTRPPSMRKRQSMQFADLEQRFEQLAADHRSLTSAKSAADRRLEEQARDHSQQRQTYEDAVQEHKSYLLEKDAELSRLHDILDGFKRQVSELTSVNEELQTSRGLDPDRVGDQSFQILAGQHDTTKRELEGLREQHTRLAKDHEDILEREIEAVRQEKDYELQQLQEELESAKEQVKSLQQQILASRSDEDYIEHDEDYFESKCTALCQQVQQWVLRFSKFSDSHACRLVGELKDDTLADLFDDAILDGTEVDEYLQDRIKRRDVLMSVVMSRIFDFVFRRYLFGLDREHRKKLKDLDATLTEVGPQSAVHKWRSTTLTLLSSRPEFADQREDDTEGVVDSIFQTLAAILPPKKDLIPQITDSLRRVIAMAVDLHIEMRLQRAEFQMLPPLKPQFDPATGDLTRKVPFNATMMNERSGDTQSNDQLQDDGAVVRMVLFPLVVKNSDEEEQIVVCPAQVLVAKEGEDEKKTNDSRGGRGKQVRVVSAQGGGGGGSRSEASFTGTEDTRMTGDGGMF